MRCVHIRARCCFGSSLVCGRIRSVCWIVDALVRSTLFLVTDPFPSVLYAARCLTSVFPLRFRSAWCPCDGVLGGRLDWWCLDWCVRPVRWRLWLSAVCVQVRGISGLGVDRPTSRLGLWGFVRGCVVEFRGRAFAIRAARSSCEAYAGFASLLVRFPFRFGSSLVYACARLVAMLAALPTWSRKCSGHARSHLWLCVAPYVL